MSGKSSKKMRKEVKSQLDDKAELIVDTMCAQKFRVRVKIAQRILMGWGTEPMRVRAIRKRNKMRGVK